MTAAAAIGFIALVMFRRVFFRMVWRAAVRYRRDDERRDGDWNDQGPGYYG